MNTQFWGIKKKKIQIKVGLKRWLSAVVKSTHWLLFQGPQVQFPATSWRLTTSCNEI